MYSGQFSHRHKGHVRNVEHPVRHELERKFLDIVSIKYLGF